MDGVFVGNFTSNTAQKDSEPMLAKPLLLAVALFAVSVSSLLGMVPGKEGGKANESTEEKSDSEKQLIEQLQGKWTVMRGKQRWVKEYKGNKEAFTIYDGESAVHGHSHDIQIKKQGLVQICTTSNDEVTIGPRKGANLKGIAFVIKIDGDKIFEAVGLLEKDKPVV